jgi:hypothetical protein
MTYVEFFFEFGKAVAKSHEMNIEISFSVCVKFRFLFLEENRNCRYFETDWCEAHLSTTVSVKLVVKGHVNFVICTFQVVLLR